MSCLVSIRAAARALALVVLLLPWPDQALAQNEESLTSFHADIRIEADGSLEVVETIALYAMGREIRRGFIREFPTRYRDHYGNRVVVGFDMLEATRNGRPEPYWTERVSNGVEIFLGDDSFLEVPATHTYTLRYRTTRQMGFFKDFDELYWNVTGTGWIFPIRASSATVRLPAEVAESDLRLACYSGAQDADGRDCRFRVLEPGVVHFEASRGLDAREGLTIAVGFPKGLVIEPTQAARVGHVMRDNAGLLLALAGFLTLLGWYLWQWNSKGRDPASGVIFPRYEPPAGHSPAGIRFLRRMGWDHRCFSADLVDAAVRGFLTIHRDKPTREMLIASLPEAERKTYESSGMAQRVLDLVLRNTKELWRLERNLDGDQAALTEGQRAIATHVFAGGPQLLLRNSDPATVKVMQAANKAQRVSLEKQYSPSHFVVNGGVVARGVLFSVLFLIPAFILGTADDGAGVPLIMMIVVLTVILHFVMANLMKQPTAEGRRLLDEIEGLRVYLGLAEKAELGRLQGPGNEPALDADRYEQLLPYALALDVEDAWTRKFTAAALAAGAVAAASGASRWYRGNLAQVSNLGDMSKSLGSALSSQIASASSPPGSSSGSGGGGRSGGGGGGGGGRGR
jgi:uncharacterized membrane protein YgcG